jgi:hypothetical protein
VSLGTSAGGMGRPLKRDSAGQPIYDSEYFVFQKANYEYASIAQ